MTALHHPTGTDRPAVHPSDTAEHPIHRSDVLVVLDAHGVVFNRAFPMFVHDRALARGDDPVAVWDRWRGECRLDLWEGRIAPDTMWAHLFPGDDPSVLTAGLRDTYDRGPLYDDVVSSRNRMWLLSNHCSEWLMPQLRRFGLVDRFERVLVSDQLGMAKPSSALFELVREEAGGPVVLYDDSEANVAAARRAGLDAHHVTDEPPGNGALPPRGPDRGSHDR
ncbi:MAG: HAD family hydrolase [Actinomycetota bacterium]|nr:HAD family hydrolase [Actinomycetota bacterium]